MMIGLLLTCCSQASEPFNDNEIERIQVVARKKLEWIQDVPLPVTAITHQRMKSFGIRDIADLPALIPSLKVTSNANPFTASFKIRRVGNEGNIPDFEPIVALFVDGAYRPRSGLGLGDLVDIERIEVLRGPQSTLYGKNVSAGVVSVITAKPTAESISFAELTTGSDDLIAFKGYGNGALNYDVNGRISVSATKQNSRDINLIGTDSNNLNQHSIRGQLLITPYNNLQVRVIAAYVNRDMLPAQAGMFYGERLVELTNQVVANPQSFIDNGQGLIDGVINPSAQFILDNNPSNRIGQAFDTLSFKQRAHELITDIQFDADKFTVHSITSFDQYNFIQSWRDAAQLGLDVLNYRDRQAAKSYSQEFRLEHKIGADIDAVSGLFYYQSDFRRGDHNHAEFTLGSAADEVGAALGYLLLPADNSNLGLPILGLPGDTGNYHQVAKSYSSGIFSQASWQYSDAVSLTLGIRFIDETKQVSLENHSTTNMPEHLVSQLPVLVDRLTSPQRSFVGKDSWQALTGNFTAKYRLDVDTMYYATVASGFKGGGFNGGFGNTPAEKRPFEPERVLNYELGIKSNVLNDSSLNVSAFQTEYSNYQAASFIGLQWLVNNAEQVNIRGVEAEFHAPINGNFTADIAASYVIAKYARYTQGSCYTNRLPTDEVTGGCDLSDDTLPYAPRLNVSFAGRWQQDLSFASVYANLGIHWQSKQNVTGELDPKHGVEPSYAVTNVRLGLKRHNWEFALWSRNIANKTYNIHKSQSNLFASLRDGTYQSYLGEARAIGISLSAQF